MQRSIYYNMNLPDGPDRYNVEDFNANVRIIDEELHNSVASIAEHIADKNNPHSVTKAQIGLGNVDNKSSATIRGELTKKNVTDALGYTPAEAPSGSGTGGIVAFYYQTAEPTSVKKNTIWVG